MAPRSRPLLKLLLAVAAGLALVPAALVAQRAEPALALPSDLYFSEYVEGSSSNKALEIYNGTGADVTLSGAYDVQIFANGSPTSTGTIALTGTVAAGGAFVLARSAASPALLALADQTTTNFLFNGNDAVALRRNGVVIDVIGQIGFDPGTEWGSGDTSTADNTLRRRPGVTAGDPDGSDPFLPELEWLGLPLDAFDGLGAHEVESGNGKPDAADDALAVAEDGGPSAVDVLANDTDPDGDPLAITGFGQGAHGTVALGSEGRRLSYAPDNDFSGSDSFAYTIGDGRGGQDRATVTVTVSPVNDEPDAVADTAQTDEDTPVALDVLANDRDPDGDALAVSAVTQGAAGSVRVDGDGTVTYAPDPDFHGSDSFAYTVSDGNGGLDRAEVEITVAPVNDPPEAADDTATVSGGAAVAVLENDSDPEGEPLTVVAVTQGLKGAVAIAEGGSAVTYTPAPGAGGADTFTYTVSDGSGGSDTATVSLAILDGDHTPPTITIAAPAQDSVLRLGEVAFARYACADEPGGSGLSSCLGSVTDRTPLDTASLGRKTFTVAALDEAGNSSFAAVDYRVVYDFSGFFRPVENLPALTVVRAGRRVPVRFSLGGFQGFDIFAPGFPSSREIPCPEIILDGGGGSAATGTLSYRRRLDRYVFGWKTAERWAGTTRQLVLKLADGTYQAANFRFPGKKAGKPDGDPT